MPSRRAWMEISRIRAYRVDLPLHDTTYKWSGGESVTVFDRTVIGSRRTPSSITARSVPSARSTFRPTWKACGPASAGWDRN